jgi:hypothetical protein
MPAANVLAFSITEWAQCQNTSRLAFQIANAGATKHPAAMGATMRDG